MDGLGEDALHNVVKTAMSSKLLAAESALFADMLVKAVISVR